MAEGREVRGLIEALGDTLTEGGIAFDEEGRAAFDAGDGLLIGIDHLPNAHQLLLHAELGLLPGEPAASALRRELLDASLPLAADLGGALAVDQATGTVALFARRSAEDLDFAAFERWVGDFADTAADWAERLRDRAPAAER